MLSIRTFRLSALAAACCAAAAAMADPQPPYSVFDVSIRNDKEARRLMDSNVHLISCDIERHHPTRIAVRKGEEFQVYALNLPTQYLGIYQPADHGPAQGVQDGFDYRTEYGNYDTLIAEWDSLANQFPHIVTKVQIGNSIQNRPIYGYRIYKNDAQEVFRPQKSILILGATHSREWVSPPTVLHIGKMLAQELASQDNAFTDRLVDRVGVFIVPIVNPDGYVYTWTTNRLWRKNRRLNSGGSYGVDINRNYGYQWGNNNGSSGTPTSETYRGTAPFSEPETQAVRDWALSMSGLLGFIDYHSYGQHIVHAWSYTTTPAPHNALMQSIGNAIRTSIQTSGGAAYDSGQAAVLMYISSGASKDYFYGTFTVPSYTIELRNTSTFELPPSQIAPTQDENWAGFKTFVTQITTP